MGAAVNQNAVSKVMLCFTLAPHKSHWAWHLSGCRSETRYAAPLTQTPRPLGRWRGWLVSCLLQNEVTSFCSVSIFFFNKVQQNNWKWKDCQRDTCGKFEREKFMSQLLGKMVFITAFYRQTWKTYSFNDWRDCQNASSAANSTLIS